MTRHVWDPPKILGLTFRVCTVCGLKDPTIINQIHDEQIFEYVGPDDDCDLSLVKQIMET